jgi:hypothetical protein
MISQVKSFASILIPTFERRNTKTLSTTFSTHLILLASGIAAFGLGNSKSEALPCKKLTDMGMILTELAVNDLIATYFHELGHAVAMSILYSNSKPKIVLYDDGGGECRPNVSQIGPKYSKLALFLGENNSRAIISAAGPLVDCVNLLALAYISSSSDQKNIHALAFGANILTSIGVVEYASSLYTKKKLEANHDYGNVKRYAGNSSANALVITAIACSVFSLFFTELQYHYNITS